MSNEEPLFIGSVPWHRNECSVPVLIDEVRIYNKVVYSGEIEASPALGGLEANFLHLGCIDCTL